MHILSTIILFALFASTFSIQNQTLKIASPLFFVGSRMLLAGVILLGGQLIIAKLRKKHWLKIPKKQWFNLLILALLNIYLTNALEAWGAQHMLSSKTCLIYSLSPFMAALVAYLVLKERLSQKKWLGLLIGFCGLIPIFLQESSLEKQQAGMYYFLSYAELALLGAVLCSVCGWVILKKIINAGLSPVTANGISMLLGGALALMHSCYLESWQPIPVQSDSYTTFLANALSLCLISNIICYNLYGYLLQKFSATFMSFAGLVTPLFAIIFGWWFLQEPLHLSFFLSIAIFAVGLSIFYYEETRHKRVS